MKKAKNHSLIFYFALIIGLTVVIEVSQASEKNRISYVRDACTSAEQWSFSRNIPEVWRKELRDTIKSEKTVIRGFSEALALRTMEFNAESKVLAEYWIARTLYNAGLHHIAHSGFSVIASRPLIRRTMGPQMAAIDCLNRIGEEYPTLSISGTIYQNILTSPEIKEESILMPIAWEAISGFFRDQIAEGHPVSQLLKTLKFLKGAGAFEDLSNGLYAAHNRKHHDTIKYLEQFLAQNSRPATLNRFMNPVRLLLARAYYSVGAFESAVSQYKLVKKDSNELTFALTELSWAFLLDEKFGQAIGTTINLQSGGLKKTFAPEAPMVMAMALNELCQYPESIKAINIFRKTYKTSFRWLEGWHTNRNSNDGVNLYQRAVNFLKGEKQAVPQRIASEWLRSPLFIARQDEINLVYKEKKLAVTLGKKGESIQQASAVEVLELLRETTDQVKRAKQTLKPTEPFPSYLTKNLEKLREMVVHYKRVRRAAPYWRKILNTHESRTGTIIANQVQHINKDLRKLNIRMYHQLHEVAENNYFIEVEIYNGASQDIIWQNAHPDYAKVAAEIDETPEERRKQKTMDWGTVSYGLEGTGEIWEDELGSFKADIYDNCSNKEKYLNLKRAQLVENSK